MSRILYRATAADGNGVTDFVEAGSAAEAMRLLIDRGLNDVVLLQSPGLATFNETPPGLTPEQHARLRVEVMAKPGLVAAMRRVATRNVFPLALCVAVLCAGAWLHEAWLVVAGLALFAYPFAMLFWKRRHLSHYQRLAKAYALGHWDEVRRLAPKVKQASSNALLPWDVDVRLACIEALEGHLEAALASLEAWREPMTAKAAGMFEARLASVYFAARDYDGYQRLMDEAAELSGNDPSRLVDVAMAHAKFGDLHHAQAILAGIDTSLLPPVAQPFVRFVNGVILLRDNRPDVALQDLQAARDEFLRMSLKSPSAWAAMAAASGYLALALARCDKPELAQQVVADVLPMLRVHGEKPLIDMLQSEVLQPAA